MFHSRSLLSFWSKHRAKPEYRAAAPFVVLCSTLLLTAIVTVSIELSAREKDKLRFDNSVQRVLANIQEQLRMDIGLLRAGQGLFAANPSVDQAAFRTFVRQLDLRMTHPELQGLGVSLRLSPQQKQAVEAEMRRQGVNNFTIRPDYPRDEYHAIVYLEPPDQRNQAAVGYDMFTEPIRRAAMERARDTGQPVASGRVTLVQEIDQQKQSGFLIYMPIYRNRDLPSTVAQRRAQLQGFIYSPFRAGDFIRGVFGAHPETFVDFAIYDGTDLRPDTLLYQSSTKEASSNPQYQPLFTTTQTIDVAGRPWTLVLTSRPELDMNSERRLVPLLGVLGGVISLILFAVMRSQTKAYVATEQALASLRESEERFQAFMDHNPAAAWITDSEGRVVYLSATYYQTFDIPKQAVGKTLHELFPAEYADGFFANLQTVIRDSQVLETVKTAPLSDGTIGDFLVYEFPVMDRSGTRLVGGVAIDITERRQSTERLQQSEMRFRMLVEQSPVSIQIFAPSGETLQVNHAWEDLWGITFADISDYNILQDQQLIDKGIMPYIQRGFAGETVVIPAIQYVVEESVNVDRATPNPWVQAFIYPIKDETGRIREVVLMHEDITEQKLAAEALSDANKRVSTILESITDAFVAFDRDWRYTYVNDAAEHLLQRSRDELLGKQIWTEVFPHAMTDVIYQELHRAVAEQNSIAYEGFSVSLGCWLEVRAYPSREGLAVYFRDTTDRKQAEQEREQLLQREQTARIQAETAEHQLATIFETSPVGMAILDAQQRFISINDALAEIHGLSCDQHLGQTIADVFGESDPNLVQLFQEIYTTGTRFVSPNFALNPPGRRDRRPGYYNVYYLPNSTAAGEVQSVLVYMVDVTERFLLEETQRFLAESSKLLATSLDYQTTLTSIAQLTVPRMADWCTVHIVDETGETRQLAVAHANPDKVRWANELQERYPYDPDTPRGVPQVILTGQSELYQEIPDELLVLSAKDEDHLQILREVGFSSVMIVPIQVRDRTLGAISFVAAESGRRYSEQDLSLAEEIGRRAALAVDNAQLYDRAKRDRAEAQAANRIKDEFLAVLSHELRSPLNPILGWTRLLRTRKFNAQMVDQALETIERNAKLQTQLIEDLLDVSRILRGKMALNVAPVNLVTTIKAALETVRLSAAAKDISLQTTLDPAVGAVLGDSGRLQQVIWNLLSNAVKFTPEHGRVEVRLEEVSRTRLPSTEAASDSYAQISVIDTGKGINPEFLPHVFEYFRQEDGKTTRQFGGLGLGLAIARHLTELHGGTIHVTSPGEGLGTTFSVRLPILQDSTLLPQAGEVEPASLNPNELPLQNLKILVVDDAEDMREIAATILTEHGAHVELAMTAPEALKRLDMEPPDVLISDIGMPGMDGYMLMQQVRQRSADQGGSVPAIALTAYAGEGDQQQAIAAGFQLHLPKPVEPEELVKAILSLVEPSAPS